MSFTSAKCWLWRCSALSSSEFSAESSVGPLFGLMIGLRKIAIMSAESLTTKEAADDRHLTLIALTLGSRSYIRTMPCLHIQRSLRTRGHSGGSIRAFGSQATDWHVFGRVTNRLSPPWPHSLSLSALHPLSWHMVRPALARPTLLMEMLSRLGHFSFHIP